MIWLVPLAVAATPADCRQAFEALKYREAIEACSAAVPGASPAQVVELYRILGSSFAAVDENERAEAAFISMLALDSTAELSAATSPKIRAPFERARQQAASRVVLAVRAAAAPRVGAPTKLEAVVDDGPARPSSRITARQGAQVQSAARAEPTELTLEAPARSGPLEVEVTAVDRFGGALASRVLVFEVPPARGPALSWKLWGGAGVVAGLAAGALGIAGQLLQSRAVAAEYASDARALHESARGLLGGALASAALAAVLLIVSGGLFATAPE